jgi:hypothetical protein
MSAIKRTNAEDTTLALGTVGVVLAAVQGNTMSPR